MIDLAMEQKNRKVLAKWFKTKADATQDAVLKADYLERSRTHGYKAEMERIEKTPKVRKAAPKCESCEQCGS